MTLPTLSGRSVTMRPPLEGELENLAGRIVSDPEVSPWWGTGADRVLEWLTGGEVLTFVIARGDEVIGVVTVDEETEPDYRSANIDIAIFSPHTGRGLGVDAIDTLARWLFAERDHHRLTIDPTVTNVRAIRAYEKVGFKRVGVMRRYERGPDRQWRDGLLMDLLEEDLVEPDETAVRNPE